MSSEAEAGPGRQFQLRSEHWAIVVTTVLVTLFLVLDVDIGEQQKTPVEKLQVGKSINVVITLVTADVRDLACASNQEGAGARCLFDSYGRRREDVPAGPAGASPTVLAPYMTTDNHLFLIPGLFAEPAIARRLAAEPPGDDREKLDRFNATCKFEPTGRVDELAVRWEPTAEFGPRQEGAWVGTLSGCSLTNP